LIWVNAIRDVGFPAVVAMVLLYALLVRFPETLRQIMTDNTDRILIFVTRDQELTQQSLENHKRTQSMLDEALRMIREIKKN
jgi:hypothetical protein